MIMLFERIVAAVGTTVTLALFIAVIVLYYRKMRKPQ